MYIQIYILSIDYINNRIFVKFYKIEIDRDTTRSRTAVDWLPAEFFFTVSSILLRSQEVDSGFVDRFRNQVVHLSWVLAGRCRRARARLVHFCALIQGRDADRTRTEEARAAAWWPLRQSRARRGDGRTEGCAGRGGSRGWRRRPSGRERRRGRGSGARDRIERARARRKIGDWSDASNGRCCDGRRLAWRPR